MPNWCNNIVTLTHEDPAQIKRVVDSLQVGLFNEFIPMPDQLRNTEMSTATPEEVYEKNVQDCGYPSWYEFAIAEWDTLKGFNKWYLTISVGTLMLITSAGIFGYLSNAFQQQNLGLQKIERDIAVYQTQITKNDGLD